MWRILRRFDNYRVSGRNGTYRRPESKQNLEVERPNYQYNAQWLFMDGRLTERMNG